MKANQPKRIGTVLIAPLLLFLPLAAAADGPGEGIVSSPGLAGMVTAAAQPIDAVKVYAYETGTFSFRKVLTDAAGRFLFTSLPAGIYQIIALKDGFQPAIADLERQRDDLVQRLELELAAESQDDARDGESYWAVRKAIPPDVLRDALGTAAGLVAPDVRAVEVLVGGGAAFETRLEAGGGMARYGTGLGTQMARADLGLHGQVGGVEVGVEGRYQRLEGRRHDGAFDGTTRSGGQAHALALQVEAPASSQVRLITASGEISETAGPDPESVGLEHHQLRWSGQTGENARSGFMARYLEESNYYRPGFVELAAIPSSSRTLAVEGFYAREVTDAVSFEAGMLYSERQDTSALASGDADEIFGLYGDTRARILPRVLVEIGIFSKVHDGGLSLMPRGTFVIDLGSDWRAEASVAKRVEERGDGAAPFQGFTAVAQGDERACREAGEACYQVLLAYGDEEQPTLTLGAIHREYAETLRVYFSDDFFSRLESLFLVRGDELPEFQMSLVRRITPKILARLESNFASGGGGIFYATDERAYENRIRYLVTSLDTRFEHTSTGVFIAFHHLEQGLDRVGSGQEAAMPTAAVEQQRLQLMLTQDLDALMNVSSSWAVRLNMELSRGSTPYTLTADDELYKTLTGGFSVSF